MATKLYTVDACAVSEWVENIGIKPKMRVLENITLDLYRMSKNSTWRSITQMVLGPVLPR